MFDNFSWILNFNSCGIMLMLLLGGHCVQGVSLLRTTCGTPNYVAPEVIACIYLFDYIIYFGDVI